ncbi:MAG: hypothetical protein JWO95_1774 [Verrucomicrobiales bacterium]|nr:hypothetical protein [Verrucomicrobiales bacterium]
MKSEPKSKNSFRTWKFWILILVAAALGLVVGLLLPNWPKVH